MQRLLFPSAKSWGNFAILMHIGCGFWTNSKRANWSGEDSWKWKQRKSHDKTSPGGRHQQTFACNGFRCWIRPGEQIFYYQRIAESRWGSSGWRFTMHDQNAQGISPMLIQIIPSEGGPKIALLTSSRMTHGTFVDSNEKFIKQDNWICKITSDADRGRAWIGRTTFIPKYSSTNTNNDYPLANGNSKIKC